MTEKSSRRFKTHLLRLSFPTLDKPGVTNKDDVAAGRAEPVYKYSAMLILPSGESTDQYTVAMRTAAAEKWPGKRLFLDFSKVPPGSDRAQVVVVPQAKRLLRPCAEKEYNGFSEGSWYFTAKSETPVPCVDEHGRVIPTEQIRTRLYAGCYVHAFIEVYAYSHPKGGNGFAAGLLGVQFARDGERLDKRATPGIDEMFEPLIAGELAEADDMFSAGEDGFF